MIKFKNYNLYIYNIFGKKIFEIEGISNENIDIDFSYFPSGSYLIVLKDTNAIAKKEFIIVE